MENLEDDGGPSLDLENIKLSKKIKRRKLFFSLMRNIIYWVLCTLIMILLDNYGYITKYFAWFLGSLMMAIYASVEFRKG